MSILSIIKEHMKKARAVNSGVDYIPPNTTQPQLDVVDKVIGVNKVVTKKKAKSPSGIITIDDIIYKGDNFFIRGKNIQIDNSEAIICTDDSPMIIDSIQGVIRNLVITHPLTINSIDKGTIDVMTDSLITIEGDVNGDITTTGSASVTGNVTGSISSEGDVICGDVGGDVGGDVEVIGNITCKSIGGDISNATHVIINGDVGGNIECDENVNCGNVRGTISGYDITITGSVTGDINADNNLTCTDITGEVNIGGDCTCGNITGNCAMEGDGTINGVISGARIEVDGDLTIGFVGK